jgi:hypothetical protein
MNLLWIFDSLNFSIFGFEAKKKKKGMKKKKSRS